MTSIWFVLASIVIGDPQVQRQRDQFVYGTSVVDVLLSRERFGALDRPVTDCSNEAFVCVHGHVLDVVMPRVCPTFEPGQTFALAGTRTEVIATYPRGEHGDKYRTLSHYTQPVQLLGNPDKPWVVYVYSRQGVIGLYYDFDERRDLLSIGRQGGIDALDAEAGPSYYPLRTFMGAAICSPAPRPFVEP